MRATQLTTGAFGEPFAQSGCVPQGANQGGDRTTNVVPAGEVWEIHAASVGQTAPIVGFVGLMLSLHIELMLEPADQGIHVFALTGMRTSSLGTPLLALDRRVILMPGMRLGVRFDTPPEGLHVSLMAYGFKYPIADLDRLLLHGTSGPAPDFSALLLAADQAAAALTAMAGSVPA
jgi:hypothetical protein